MAQSIAHKLRGGVQLIRACQDWRPWFREYLTRPNDGAPTRYRMRNGAVFNMRRNRMDNRILDEVWAYRKYDYFGFKVEPGSVVVDVGANIGVFALYAAIECGASRVVAFEPHPENFGLLERNVRVNGLQDVVTCVNAAVAGEGGVAQLAITQENSGGHSLISNGGKPTIEVAALTLEDALAEHGIDQVDYLKLDCEGAEYEILVSVAPEVLDRVRAISMEYHEVPGRSVQDITDVLAKRGFSVRTAEGDRLYARSPAR